MGKLCMSIPPFSPDYSGVCSALFELNCLTVIHDAAGCTGNYVGYDEPRWFGSKAPIYCSRLREIDAVLGDDEKLIQKIFLALEDIQPDMIAIVGSPVPMVIGTDMEGIAEELEYRTGIPTFGFDTTGTKYYTEGISQVSKKLFERFVDIDISPEKNCVNLLGATPLDYGVSNNVGDVRDLLVDHGYKVNASLWNNSSLEQVKMIKKATVNIVFSQADLETAKYLEKVHQIPYIVGLPIGKDTEWFHALKEVIESKKSKVLVGVGGKANILILGEEVISNSLRVGLEKEYHVTADVGCVFGKIDEIALEQDWDLIEEADIRAAINSKQYDIIIGDPMFEMLLDKKHPKKMVKIAHYATSSKLGLGNSVDYIGKNFNQFVKSLLLT